MSTKATQRVWNKSLTLNIKSEQNKLSDTQNTVLFAFLSNLSILTIYNKEFLKSKFFVPDSCVPLFNERHFLKIRGGRFVKATSLWDFAI